MNVPLMWSAAGDGPVTLILDWSKECASSLSLSMEESVQPAKLSQSDSIASRMRCDHGKSRAGMICHSG